MATIPPPRPPTTLNDLCREYKFVTANHAAWQKQYETYKTIKKEYNELVDKSQSKLAPPRSQFEARNMIPVKKNRLFEALETLQRCETAYTNDKKVLLDYWNNADETVRQNLQVK